MASPSALAELRDLLDPSDCSPSSPPPAQAESLASESAPPFAVSQEAAEALFSAADAKAVLLQAQQALAAATARLDELVDAGLLPTKGLPTVGGMAIYRQEGRVSWKYPAAIKELEAHLKKRKQLAEQLGEATQSRGEPFWTIKEATPLAPDTDQLATLTQR